MLRSLRTMHYALRTTIKKARLNRGPALSRSGRQTAKEEPQPQPPVELGLVKVKPEPWNELA